METEGYFIAYYLLMCVIGAVVIVSTVMRNRASTPRRCHNWNRVAMGTWVLGAVLFAVYVIDAFNLT